jgi:RNA polymerase sigma-70 factor (ECF subfamily)
MDERCAIAPKRAPARLIPTGATHDPSDADLEYARAPGREHRRATPARRAAVLPAGAESHVLRTSGEARVLRPDGCRQAGVLRVTADGAAPQASVVDLVAPLRAFLARRAPTDVDPADLLQDVMLRVHQRLGSLRDAERLDAWIFQIARNVLADALRARRRRAAVTTPEPLDAETALADDPGAASRDATRELAACLAPMVARLPEPYRSALEWTELGPLTQAEAARRAGISLSGMKSRVQRGREQLKAVLLECCAIDLDVRRGVVDYRCRDACRSASAPRTGGCGTPKKT